MAQGEDTTCSDGSWLPALHLGSSTHIHKLKFSAFKYLIPKLARDGNANAVRVQWTQ